MRKAIKAIHCCGSSARHSLRPCVSTAHQSNLSSLHQNVGAGFESDHHETELRKASIKHFIAIIKLETHVVLERSGGSNSFSHQITTQESRGV